MLHVAPLRLPPELLRAGLRAVERGRRLLLVELVHHRLQPELSQLRSAQDDLVRAVHDDEGPVDVDHGVRVAHAEDQLHRAVDLGGAAERAGGV